MILLDYLVSAFDFLALNLNFLKTNKLHLVLPLREVTCKIDPLLLFAVQKRPYNFGRSNR